MSDVLNGLTDLPDPSDEAAATDGDAARPDAGPDDAASAPDGPDADWTALLIRLTGLLLIPLTALVFAYGYVVNDVAELNALDFGRRWSSGFWRFTDWAFLFVALLHAMAGWHCFLRRHAPDDVARLVIEGATMAAAAVVFVYASLSIL